MITEDVSQNLDFESMIDGFGDFFDYAKSVLEQYFPSITNYLKWGYLILEDNPKISNSVDTFLYGDYETNLLFSNRRHNLKNIGDFKRINNVASNCLYYIIDDFNNNKDYSIVRVSDKEDFMKLLKLNNPEDLYDSCPFLLRLLHEGIKYCSRVCLPLGYAENYKYNESDDLECTIHELAVRSANRDDLLSPIFISSVVTNALFDLDLPNVTFFHSVAGFNYEGNENRGHMDFLKQGNRTRAVNRFISHDPLVSTDPKFIRKLLEMTDDHGRLLVSPVEKPQAIKPLADWEIYGIGEANDNTYAEVQFLGLSRWTLSFNSETVSYDGRIFSIKNKNAPSDQSELDKLRKFYNDIKRPEEQLAKIEKVFEILKKQIHGTMVVISENAELEADRLCSANRGIRVEPFDCSVIDEQVLLKFSSIDGALLLNPDCECFALGVILDGRINTKFGFKGDSSRGARYNSAKLYIQNLIEQNKNTTKKNEASAIVFSEDGYLNVFNSTSISESDKL